jgi:hypothetical protein
MRAAVNVVTQMTGTLWMKIILQLTLAAENSTAGRISVAGCKPLT